MHSNTVLTKVFVIVFGKFIVFVFKCYALYLDPSLVTTLQSCPIVKSLIDPCNLKNLPVYILAIDPDHVFSFSMIIIMYGVVEHVLVLDDDRGLSKLDHLSKKGFVLTTTIT